MNTKRYPSDQPSDIPSTSAEHDRPDRIQSTYQLALVDGRIRMYPSNGSPKEFELFMLCVYLLDDNTYHEYMIRADVHLKSIAYSYAISDTKLFFMILMAYRKNNFGVMRNLVTYNKFPSANHEALRELYARCPRGGEHINRMTKKMEFPLSIAHGKASVESNWSGSEEVLRKMMEVWNKLEQDKKEKTEKEEAEQKLMLEQCDRAIKDERARKMNAMVGSKHSKYRVANVNPNTRYRYVVRNQGSLLGGCQEDQWSEPVVKRARIWESVGIPKIEEKPVPENPVNNMEENEAARIQYQNRESKRSMKPADLDAEIQRNAKKEVGETRKRGRPPKIPRGPKPGSVKSGGSGSAAIGRNAKKEAKVRHMIPVLPEEVVMNPPMEGDEPGSGNKAPIRNVEDVASTNLVVQGSSTIGSRTVRSKKPKQPTFEEEWFKAEEEREKKKEMKAEAKKEQQQKEQQKAKREEEEERKKEEDIRKLMLKEETTNAAEEERGRKKEERDEAQKEHERRMKKLSAKLKQLLEEEKRKKKEKEDQLVQDLQTNIYLKSVPKQQAPSPLTLQEILQQASMAEIAKVEAILRAKRLKRKPDPTPLTEKPRTAPVVTPTAKLFQNLQGPFPEELTVKQVLERHIGWDTAKRYRNMANQAKAEGGRSVVLEGGNVVDSQPMKVAQLADARPNVKKFEILDESIKNAGKSFEIEESQVPAEVRKSAENEVVEFDGIYEMEPIVEDKAVKIPQSNNVVMPETGTNPLMDGDEPDFEQFYMNLMKKSKISIPNSLTADKEQERAPSMLEKVIPEVEKTQPKNDAIEEERRDEPMEEHLPSTYSVENEPTTHQADGASTSMEIHSLSDNNEPENEMIVKDTGVNDEAATNEGIATSRERHQEYQESEPTAKRARHSKPELTSEEKEENAGILEAHDSSSIDAEVVEEEVIDGQNLIADNPPIEQADPAPEREALEDTQIDSESANPSLPPAPALNNEEVTFKTLIEAAQILEALDSSSLAKESEEEEAKERQDLIADHPPNEPAEPAPEQEDPLRVEDHQVEPESGNPSLPPVPSLKNEKVSSEKLNAPAQVLEAPTSSSLAADIVEKEVVDGQEIVADQPPFVPAEPAQEQEALLRVEDPQNEPVPEPLSPGPAVENEEELQRVNDPHVEPVPANPSLPPGSPLENDESMLEVKQEVDEEELVRHPYVQVEPLVEHEEVPNVEADHVEEPNEQPAEQPDDPLPPRNSNYLEWSVDEMADWVFSVTTRESERWRDLIRAELMNGQDMECFLDRKFRDDLNFPLGPWRELAKAAKEIMEQ